MQQRIQSGGGSFARCVVTLLGEGAVVIKKILRLKGIGQFEDYVAQGPVALGRVTVIYGENGRGKTTLAAVLRSLSQGDASLIQERRRLGTSHEPEAQLLVESQPLTYNAGRWLGTYPLVEVFDETFVNRNVYSGDAIEPEHRRNLHRFVLGESDVKLAQDIDKLSEDIKLLTQKLGKRQQEIEKLIQSGISADEFAALPELPDVDQRLAAKEAEFESARQSQVLLQAEVPAKLTMPAVDLFSLTQLLSRNIEGISEEAERKVREHVDRYMDERGEAWISQGLGYVRNDTCPFCGQALSGSRLIDLYKTYFGEAYQDLKKALSEMRRQLDDGVLSNATLLSMVETITRNEALIRWWRQYLSAPQISFPVDSLKHLWDELRSAVTSALEAKSAALLEASEAGAQAAAVGEAYANLENEISEYNATIEQLNQSIRAFRQQLAIADPLAIQGELLWLKDVKRRHEPQVSQVVEEYLNLKAQKEQLDKEKLEKRKALQKAASATIAKYAERLNQLLRLFGAGFEITGVAERYYGGVPRIEYGLLINRVPVKLDAPAPQPCFRNTLSSGDRTTLAWAFFLARLEQDPNLNNKCIVFDDPLSSLDANRRAQTMEQILRIARRAKQVIVLSHDPYFLWRIWERASEDERRSLCLRRSGVGSVVSEWDIEKETQDKYFQDYFKVSGFVDGSSSTAADEVLRCVRSVLEGALRTRFPLDIKRTDTLGKIVERIERAAPTERLGAMKPWLEDLRAINEYTRQFHHSDEGGPRLQVTEAEARSYAARALRIIHGQ